MFDTVLQSLKTFAGEHERVANPVSNLLVEMSECMQRMSDVIREAGADKSEQEYASMVIKALAEGSETLRTITVEAAIADDWSKRERRRVLVARKRAPVTLAD